MLTSGNGRFDAIRKAREWVASLQARTPSIPGLIAPVEPRFPIEDVLSIVNPDIRKPFDMNEVLLRIVDDSRFSVFKPKYGPNIITTWAHIMGKTRTRQTDIMMLTRLGQVSRSGLLPINFL